MTNSKEVFFFGAAFSFLFAFFLNTMIDICTHNPIQWVFNAVLAVLAPIMFAFMTRLFSK